MSAYQFPPSSPLIGERDVRCDPFATKPHKEQQKNTQIVHEYPTPNPSSSIGRSSSPVRERNVRELEKPLKKVVFALPEQNYSATKCVLTPLKAKSGKLAKQSGIAASSDRSVRINADFNILDPDSNVLRVPLNNSRTILVGRSSKSCDYHFKTSDKTISRTHLAITSDSESNTIKIECLGFSGFGMRIPKPCLVYGSDNSNDYVLMISEGNPLRFNDIHQLGLKVTPRTINLDSNHTEFFVNRNERVTVPRVNNIFIQVRDNILLINPLEDEEEVTDDEHPVLIEKSDISNNSSLLKRNELEITENPNENGQEIAVKTHKTTENIQKMTDGASKMTVISQDAFPKAEQKFLDLREQNQEKSQIALARNTPSPRLESTPIKPYYSSTPTTPLKPKSSKQKAASEEPTPTFSFNAHHMNFSDVESTPNRKVLGDITNLKRSHEVTAKSNKKKKIHAIQSEEPKAARAEKVEQLFSKSATPEPVSLESIPQLSEVNNVLLNHLAFSRLSSTPASFLNTISALTSGLTLLQIRSVLLNLKSIGVIYREGKDAAGKPLEEEYYYIPEEDDNVERKKLVASIKGHGGLRSCRRTHKQYYWKKPAPMKK